MPLCESLSLKVSQSTRLALYPDILTSSLNQPQPPLGLPQLHRYEINATANGEGLALPGPSAEYTDLPPEQALGRPEYPNRVQQPAHVGEYWSPELVRIHLSQPAADENATRSVFAWTK
jgi:hypothetical protein